MDFWLEGDHVAGQKAEPATPLRGRFRGESLTSELAAQRARDRVAEDTR